MAKQIDLFPSSHPILQDMLEYCKIETGTTRFDNETGEMYIPKDKMNYDSNL